MVRRRSRRQFDGSDAEGPDVGLKVVTRDLLDVGIEIERMKRVMTLFIYLLHDFRRHPARRADESVARLLPTQVPAGRQPRRDAEIRNLHGALFAEEDVARFNVPNQSKRSVMNNVFPVSRVRRCYL